MLGLPGIEAGASAGFAKGGAWVADGVGLAPGKASATTAGAPAVFAEEGWVVDATGLAPGSAGKASETEASVMPGTGPASAGLPVATGVAVVDVRAGRGTAA